MQYILPISQVLQFIVRLTYNQSLKFEQPYLKQKKNICKYIYKGHGRMNHKINKEAIFGTYKIMDIVW